MVSPFSGFVTAIPVWHLIKGYYYYYIIIIIIVESIVKSIHILFKGPHLLGPDWLEMCALKPVTTVLARSVTMARVVLLAL